MKRKPIVYIVRLYDDGHTHEEMLCNGHTFAEAYAAMKVVQTMVNHTVDTRRLCPFNPKNRAPK